MADQKPTLDDAIRQIGELRQKLADQARTITFMQRQGGFADSKALSMRATRIEERIEFLELDGEMLKDVAGLHVALLEDHLKDRHDADLDRDNAIDVINFRRIRKRLHAWAEKRGLIGKRTDLRQSRQDENRLRPALQS
jgi:hypothetical protein